MTESEIKQLAEECRELAKTVTVVHAGTNYSRIAAALEQMQQQVAELRERVNAKYWDGIREDNERLKDRLVRRQNDVIDRNTRLIEKHQQLADVARERDEAVNAAWDEVLQCLKGAWPGKELGYSESPCELINQVIEERDAANRRAEEAEAARLRAIGRHSEVCQELADAEIDAEEAKAHLARMRDALQAVEWVTPPDKPYKYCPLCGHLEGAGHAWNCKIKAALSPAQPASETPAVRVVSSEVQSAIERNRSAIDNSDRGPGKCPNCGGSLEGPLRGCRKCNTWHADIKPSSVTPPCPPGHCDDCTGDCPDGPTAASEQARDDPEETRMMLVSALDELPDLFVIESWTPQQRRWAEEWAASLVAVASDHGGEPLPMPKFLSQYKKSEQAKEDAQ